MSKKRVATVWLAGCSGCHMSFLDMDEALLDLLEMADIVKSPVVDQKAFPENVDVTLVEGAVASDQHLEEIKEIRRHSKILVSFGDCAVTGNVSALRNVITKEEVLRTSYEEAPSQDREGRPPDDPALQKLIDTVVPLHHVVKVDYYIPGCPPSAKTIRHVVGELLQGREPVMEDGKTLRYG